MNQRTALIACLALLCACEAESLVTETEEARPDPQLAAQPTVEVPDEFTREPYIQSSRAEAGFEAGRAYAIATMQYWANRAIQEVELFVRDGSKSLGSRKARKEDSFFFPAYRTLGVSVAMPIDRSCGHVAEAKGLSRAWHQFLLKTSLMQWGHTGRTGSGDARQPTCRSGGCDARIILDPENEPPCADSGSPGDPDDESPSGDDEEAEEPSTDGLDCETVHLVIVNERGERIYDGPLKICE